MMGDRKTLRVLQARSLRMLLEAVNGMDRPIERDDIIAVLKDEESYSMLYYK